MSRAGQILVSHPMLTAADPFNQTVIYIFQDTPEGTQGLVLNRPMNMRMGDVAHQNGINWNCANHLYAGGPVNKSGLYMLHSDEWATSNSMKLPKHLCLSSDKVMLERLAHGDTPAYWRCFVGTAAWIPGQLERELLAKYPYTTQHSWLTLESTDAILFEYDLKEQWEKAVALSSQQMFNQYF